MAKDLTRYTGLVVTVPVLEAPYVIVRALGWHEDAAGQRKLGTLASPVGEPGRWGRMTALLVTPELLATGEPYEPRKDYRACR